jgi:hypothetical protein
MTHVTSDHKRVPNAQVSEIDIHRILARFNQERFSVATPGILLFEPGQSLKFQEMEVAFVEDMRQEVAEYLSTMPDNPADFILWFESLREWGPGQSDHLFPWLAESASHEQMRRFLQQEIAGEIGFDDLVALTQIRMPRRVKLEMARNYWDEMGRGREEGMHGPMLERLARYFGIRADISCIAAPSLALGNLMSALASNRQYTFHSVGALGAIELTAPDRARHVRDGLERLKVPKKVQHYFTLHAVLDVKHAAAWNAEVIRPLICANFAHARFIAEGALMRLLCGQRCFEAYRAEFRI